MGGLFQAETIEDYTCMKCSIRNHLSFNKIEDQELKSFLERLVTDRGDLDEDDFKGAWKEWKAKTKNPSKLTMDFFKRNIVRSMQLVKPPRILCVHLNRVTYSSMGHEILNSAHVSYPHEFTLSNILPLKELTESNNIESKYKLAALIEHIGLTPHSGHYMAYKRLFPESLKRVAKKGHHDKWL